MVLCFVDVTIPFWCCSNLKFKFRVYPA